MIRELFTNIRPRREHYIPVVIVLLLLVAGVGLAQSLPRRIADLSNLEQVGLTGQTVGNVGAVDTSSLGVRSPADVRPADAYSTQLGLLERWAHEVARFGEASLYEDQLEALARQGRAASATSPLPVSANAYASYLDNLRHLGQAAYAEQARPADANEYEIWLDHLRRMGSEK